MALKFSDQLRQAIDAAPLSRRDICQRLKLSETTLSLFMSSQRGLTMKVTDKIVALLELKLAKETKKRK